MSVAVLYDIHANLPALEVVLQEVRGLGVSQIVIGGDVLPGPMPYESLLQLCRLDIPVQFIYGNGEVAVLEVLKGREPTAVPPQYRPVIQWTAQQLGQECMECLHAWPATLRFEVAGLGEVLFCHATPRNENEIFTSLTPQEQLLPIFDEAQAPIVICGHTHMQFDRLVGKTRVVNAGSVGMPFGKPGADWLLLGPGIQLRHTDYDLANAAERIRKTSYPGAINFVNDHVLQPPSEEQMLRLFAKAEVGRT